MMRVALATIVLMMPGMLNASSPLPRLPEINEALTPFVSSHQIAGAVTIVVSQDRILHLDTIGESDIAAPAPMSADSVFWIASMTKPIAAAAVLILQDEGKLHLDDPVSKHLPEFAALRNRDGTKPPTITIRHLLTHTAGLPENTSEELHNARSLQELLDAFVTKPMSFEPGTKWAYSQTAINSLGRIVERISGQHLEDFLQDRFFKPLGMKDTTFYPSQDQLKRLAVSYKLEEGKLVPVDIFVFRSKGIPSRDRVPLANGGLFSTANDYARFAQMLLNEGSLDGKTYLKPETVQQMASVQTGDLKTGFIDGNAWGLGVCVVQTPSNVSAALSAGSYGHGGAYGTQAWIDPVTKRAYILLVQRANFPNSDASDVRKAFQDAAAKGLQQ